MPVAGRGYSVNDYLCLLRCSAAGFGWLPAGVPRATRMKGKGNAAAAAFPASGYPVVLSEAGHRRTRRFEVAL